MAGLPLQRTSTAGGKKVYKVDPSDVYDGPKPTLHDRDSSVGFKTKREKAAVLTDKGQELHDPFDRTATVS